MSTPNPKQKQNPALKKEGAATMPEDKKKFKVPESVIQKQKERQQVEKEKMEEDKRMKVVQRQTKGRDARQKKSKNTILSGISLKEKQRERDLRKQKEAVHMLLPEGAGTLIGEDGEATYEISQKEIIDAVDIRAAAKAFDLSLTEYGPYSIDYTRSGKYLAFAGAKGHVATLDWDSKTLLGEFHINQAIRDIKFLQTHSTIAVAQKRHAYIYDHVGTELHVLKQHHDILQLEYLPYHFLLCSLNSKGSLVYQDVSTGQVVSSLKTNVEFARVMKQNPQNAILHVGHNNGTVSLWSPNSKDALVKMLAHKAPVASLAINASGQYMVTAGQDSHMHIYDTRTWSKMFSVKRYKVPYAMDFSQRDILAMSCGAEVQMWQNPFAADKFSLYMQHTLPDGKANSLKFCPYEDVLGVGHTNGFSSLLVPGAGEPNYDSLEANPLQTKTQRDNLLVTNLLEKVPADTIALNAEGFSEVYEEELTEEEQIRRSHPGFVRYLKSNREDTPYHVRLMEREKRKISARKVEKEQKENGAAKRKAPEPTDPEKPASQNQKMGSALGRFTKNRRK